MSEAIPGLPPAPAPVTPRDASAVLLFRRRAQGGVEVFWLKREKALRFAGGFFAFPGGRVDKTDAAIAVANAAVEARLVVAAARELFEETGVLKARGTIPDRATLDGLRAKLLDESMTFAQVLDAHALTLDGADFPPAGRWVTPPYLGHRFDARFFLVETDADAQVWKGELESGEWIAPADALARWERGTALLHTPNLFGLEVLSRFTTLEAALTELRSTTLVDERFICHRIEFQRGVFLFPLETPTLPPAAHTNCYLLGTRELLLVDPGSPDDTESQRLVDFVRELEPEGFRAKAVVLTHHHGDHVGGAKFVANALKLPVWAHALTKGRVPVEIARTLDEGDVLELDGPMPMRWKVLVTPGHARGHLTLVDVASKAAVVGDMVAGVGTIVIDPPEGDMAEYLRQLERLKGVVGVIYPAHGPVLPDGVAKLDEYLAHRAWREARVVEALRAAAAPTTVEDLVPRVYDDVTAFVWPLAERNTVAILQKLVAERRATERDGRFALVG